jgi:hypothetical protein
LSNSIARYLKVILVLQFFFFAAGSPLHGIENAKAISDHVKLVKKEVKGNNLSEEPGDPEKSRKRKYRPKGTVVSVPHISRFEFRRFYIDNEYLLNFNSGRTLFQFYYSPGKRGPPAITA